MILYRHDSSLIFTTAQICNPSIYKTTSQPPKKMNQISVLTKTEVSHSTSSISSMASEWWWFVFWWAVWPRRIVKLCHTGCCGTNHNVIVSFFLWNIQYSIPFHLLLLLPILGDPTILLKMSCKKNLRAFSKVPSTGCKLDCQEPSTNLSFPTRGGWKFNIPLLEASNLVFYFFGRLFWKKTSLKVVHNLSNCSEFNLFSVASILLQGEIAAAYTMDRERDMDFGWVSWFERLKFQMILFIASKGCDSYFLVEETAELSNSQSFFFFGEWIMMLRSHFLIMTSHLWLYFLGWFHTDICYSLLSTSLLLDQLWSTEVCYGRLLFYTSQSVPWHGFFNVLHLKPSMKHLRRRNKKVCTMMFPWKIGILKVPCQLKKIYYMYMIYIYTHFFPKKRHSSEVIVFMAYFIRDMFQAGKFYVGRRKLIKKIVWITRPYFLLLDRSSRYNIHIQESRWKSLH